MTAVHLPRTNGFQTFPVIYPHGGKSLFGLCFVVLGFFCWVFFSPLKVLNRLRNCYIFHLLENDGCKTAKHGCTETN